MKTIRLAAAGLAAAAIVAGVATPALAQTTTTVGRSDDTYRAMCTAQIDRRVTSLDDRQQKLGDVKHLSDADRAALNGDIDATRSRLGDLKTKIASDTDRSTLRSDCQSIWTANRVYVLVLPRTRLVGVADTEVWAAGRLTDAATKLQAAIDKAKANGKDVTKAQSDLDAMKANVESGQASASGVPSSILPLTPADWNANHDVLTPARSADKSAHDDLKGARDLAKQVIADLKA